jgi:type IV pilus assembly protein PilQ
MRLKQLLSVGLAVFLSTAVAAADSQLTGVSVEKRSDATDLVIHANGALTHNDYRPADNLLLVDFPGAALGNVDAGVHALNASGVTSYQVHSYRAANGAEIARLELTLAPHANVRFSNAQNAVIVTVSTLPGADVHQAVSVPVTTAPLSPAAQTEVRTPRMTAQPVRVRGITVVRGHDGTNVEIRTTGLLTPRVLQLKSPDRLVLDLANAIPESRPHDIPVHASDLNRIRMSQYLAAPPTTRIVLDLTAPQHFQLDSTGDRLIVKLHPMTAIPVSRLTDRAMSAGVSDKTLQETGAPVKAASTALTPSGLTKTAASDFVVVHPEYHQISRPTEPQPEEPANGRASEAAKVLGAAPPVEIQLTSGSVEAAMKPEAVKAAMMQAAQTSTAPAAQAVNSSAPANCNTGRYTGEPISVNLKDVDLKDFFRLIHEISGLNVVLDPGVSGSLTIVLDDVPWDQALAIVLQNNSLQCQLNGNVLRIALPDTLRKEADALRATQEAQALAVDRVAVTRYLSYATAKNIVPTLKTFLSKRGDIIADDRTNSIIVQDIPSVIPGIDRLLKELDRKTPQVEIEARVVAATRTFARELGAQIGFGWGNGPSAVGGAGVVGTSPLQNAVPTAPKYFILGSHQIPLFSNLPAVSANSGVSFTNASNNYRLDAIITAAESRGLLKVLSRPRITTQNNVLALVRQGVQIPVVTAAQLGGPPTTTYVNAFLRLQVQPQITNENTIFLNVDVENTTPNFGVNVNGNPELITQQATTQVLVSDGGTAVIGGVIQTQDNITRDQVPFLGNVPILGNLFKHKAVSTSTQELIFFITPRIIRS